MAEAIFRSTGDAVNFTAAADYDEGDVVVIGTALLGVTPYPITSGDTAGVQVEGVFDMAVADDEALAIGVPVYWDNTNKVVTATATGNILFGVTLEAVALTTEVGLCKKVNVAAVAAS